MMLMFCVHSTLPAPVATREVHGSKLASAMDLLIQGLYTAFKFGYPLHFAINDGRSDLVVELLESGKTLTCSSKFQPSGRLHFPGTFRCRLAPVHIDMLVQNGVTAKRSDVRHLPVEFMTHDLANSLLVHSHPIGKAEVVALSVTLQKDCARK